MPATAVVIACQTLARDCGTQSFTPPTSSGPSCNRQLVNAGGAGQSADLPAPGRASALACSGDDVAHLVGVKGPHGLGAHVPGRGHPQYQRRGRFIVGRLQHGDEVVFSHGPDQLPDPATGLLDQLTKAVAPLHAAAEVLGSLVGPIAESDIDGAWVAPGAVLAQRHLPLLPEYPNELARRLS